MTGIYRALTCTLQSIELVARVMRVCTRIYPFGQVGTVLKHVVRMDGDLMPPVWRGGSDPSITICKPFREVNLVRREIIAEPATLTTNTTRHKNSASRNE